MVRHADKAPKPKGSHAESEDDNRDLTVREFKTIHKGVKRLDAAKLRLNGTPLDSLSAEYAEKAIASIKVAMGMYSEPNKLSALNDDQCAADMAETPAGLKAQVKEGIKDARLYLSLELEDNLSEEKMQAVDALLEAEITKLTTKSRQR